MPRVSCIYISFVIYIGNHYFYLFTSFMCFWIKLFSIFGYKFALTQKNHMIALAFGLYYFLFLAITSLYHEKIT